MALKGQKRPEKVLHDAEMTGLSSVEDSANKIQNILVTYAFFSYTNNTMYSLYLAIR